MFYKLETRQISQKTPNSLEILITILPALKFAAFSLAPALLLIWRLTGDDPSRLLYFPNGLLSSGEICITSLTCNGLDLYSPNREPIAPQVEASPVLPGPQKAEEMPASCEAPGVT
ncbi:hypothetical protein DSO57_1015788 [Entomophthora muscae]|uniref:Uncharacterized protein n=1 Tax=Entomophthora muscae TaxID=34485 RepID=A0ACC2T5I0_9FUNG|nr:hypothetical protein DSO57_1015788 [Entomophthora muscae]